MTDLLADLPPPAVRHAFVPRLTEPALRNADVLRRLALGQPPASRAALAAELGRDASNLHKTLGALIEGGLLAGDGVPDLTDFGRDQLARIEAAERGSAPVPPGHALLTFGEIEGDPDNARTDSGLDVEGIDELADSIAATGGFLQPPTVRPANEGGLHRLVYGHRRWLAWGRLIDRGLWTVDHAVLCPVREGDDAALTEAGIIENAQRTDLTNLEYAEGFAKLAALYRARQPGLIDADLERLIARKIGKTPRYVGQLLQVAEKASEADKQRFRDAEAARARGEKADYYWTNLRESVREAKTPALPIPDLSPKLTLALVELADAAERWKDRPIAGLEGFAVLSGAPTGGPLSTLSERKLIELRIKGVHVGAAVRLLATPAGEHLRALGFDADRADCLFRARSAVVGELSARALAADDRYHTGGVVPPPPPEATPVLGTVSGDLWASPGPAAAQPAAETPAVTLSDAEQLILLEVARASADADVRWLDRPATPITGVPTDDPIAQGLALRRLLGFGARPSGGFVACLTLAGEAALAALDLNPADSAGLEEAIVALWEDLGVNEFGDLAYATPWLLAAEENDDQEEDGDEGAPAPAATETTSEAADASEPSAGLPDDEAGLYQAGADAAIAYSRAVLAGDRGGLAAAEARYDAVACKLNGGTLFGASNPEGGRTRLRAALRAPDGASPHWGQAGRFLVQARGIRAVVEYHGLDGVGGPGGVIHAVDWDAPFPSSTGFQSILGWRAAPAMTVRAVATAIFAGLLDPDRKQGVSGLQSLNSDAHRERHDWLTPELEAEAAALDPQPNGRPVDAVAEAAAEAARRDNAAVDDLAKAMKAKLSAAREKGRGGWHDPAQCSLEELSAQLLAHVGRGDPVDVAAYCAFLFARRDNRGDVDWRRGRLSWTAEALAEQADLALGTAALAVQDCRNRNHVGTTPDGETITAAPVADCAFQLLAAAAAAFRANLEQAS